MNDDQKDIVPKDRAAGAIDDMKMPQKEEWHLYERQEHEIFPFDAHNWSEKKNKRD